MNLSISGQHYLFDVQTFAQVVLAQGGDEYHHTLYDRTTLKVIEDVATNVSQIGVIFETTENKEALEAVLAENGLEFHELIQSAPRIALPLSHPLANATRLSLDDVADYPYIYFHQGAEVPTEFHEEALAHVPRSKTIACTDRASLSELIAALNGYTVTSGILVGISDGKGLVTVPLDTDITLHLGYIAQKDAVLGALEQQFIEKLGHNLKRYARL